MMSSCAPCSAIASPGVAQGLRCASGCGNFLQFVVARRIQSIFRWERRTGHALVGAVDRFRPPGCPWPEGTIAMFRFRELPHRRACCRPGTARSREFPACPEVSPGGSGIAARAVSAVSRQSAGFSIHTRETGCNGEQSMAISAAVTRRYRPARARSASAFDSSGFLQRMLNSAARQPFQLIAKIARGLPSIIRILRQTSGNQSIHCGRGNGLQLRDRLWSVFQDRAHHADGALSIESLSTGQHFVKDGAESKDVGTRVGLGAFELFGRHVMDAAQDCSLGRRVHSSLVLRRDWTQSETAATWPDRNPAASARSW